LPMYKTR